MGHWVMTGPWVFWASWGRAAGKKGSSVWKELGSGGKAGVPGEWARGWRGNVPEEATSWQREMGGGCARRRVPCLHLLFA